VFPTVAVTSALAFFRLYSPPPEPTLVCPFRWLTTFPCPLCGMTRALCALAHGEPGLAWRLHPLSPLVLALLLAVAITGLFRIAGRCPPAPWEAPAFLAWTAAVFLAFGVLRIAGLTL
jgi:hypothetical protein